MEVTKRGIQPLSKFSCQLLVYIQTKAGYLRIKIRLGLTNHTPTKGTKIEGK